LSLANRIYFKLKSKKMQNPAKIIVLFLEGKEGLNIARRAVGPRNHKGLTKGIIMGG
jgi:hypothetical protein